MIPVKKIRIDTGDTPPFFWTLLDPGLNSDVNFNSFDPFDNIKNQWEVNFETLRICINYGYRHQNN
jgi:hypothetical protein